MAPSRVAGVLAAASTILILAACVAAFPDTDQPDQGPLPPASDGFVALDQLATLVTEADAPATMLVQVGEVSASGADLTSEQGYWVSVGGEPAECADVVSSAYLVSSADTGDRADDPTGLIGMFTEIDEDRFGLMQAYARQFDDAPTAALFLQELRQTVVGCPGYRLIGADGTSNWTTSELQLTEGPAGPAGLDMESLRYEEIVQDSDALGLTITFLRRDNVMVAVYAESYPTSTFTDGDASAIATAAYERMSALG